MNTEEMRRVICRHTLKASFPVMGAVVNYRKGQKQLKKIALYLKSTLARPPIYDRAYPERLYTASPGNPVTVRKPSLLLFFVKSRKKVTEELTSLEENYFFDKFQQ